MSVIKKSFIKIASLMLGVTLVATACDFGQSSSNSEISQSSSSEVSTQTSLPSPSSDISSSSSSSNNSTSSISSSTSSTSSSIIPAVTGISLNTDNVKKTYNYGDTLNLAGLVVTANYSNNTTTEVANYTTNIANGSELKTVGENDIVVTYLTFTASFKITVNKVLTGIELNTEAVKKEYGYNEALNLTGLVVTAKYNDNSEAVVTEYTTNPENGTVLTNLGENTVTVTYQEKTATFKVNVVKVLTGIELNTANVKKVYDYNDTLDLTGLVVTAKYNNNTEETVTDYVTDPANGTTLTTLGENTVTVTYQGKTAEFKINVIKKLVSIELNTNNVKKEFTEGDAFEATGLVVTANYNDGSNETATDYVTDPTRGTILNNVGTVTVKVTYQGFTKNYEIKVNEALVEEKGTELLLDLGVQPEFENNVANVSARGTTPKSNYFVGFQLTRVNKDNDAMTIVNSRLRVKKGDIIENTESLNGVTAFTINGGNGSFDVYAGYSKDNMYKFLKAESNGGSRIYTNVPQINYFKLVGTQEGNFSADILSIEFTYTRNANYEVVNGVETPINTLTVNEGEYLKGSKTLVVSANTVSVDGKTYTYTGIFYEGALLYANEQGAGLLVKYVNNTAVIVTDTIDNYSSLTGEYTKVIGATEIKLFVNGEEVAANTEDTRAVMDVGDTFTFSATCNAVPSETPEITYTDETHTDEYDPFFGTYTVNEVGIYDSVSGESGTINIGNVVVEKDDGEYTLQFGCNSGDGAFPNMPICYSTDYRLNEAGTRLTFYVTEQLTVIIDIETKIIEISYWDYENSEYLINGSAQYIFKSSTKRTAELDNGTVTALTDGDFYLTATASNGLEVKYYVNVRPYIIAMIISPANNTEVTLKEGDTYQLNVELDPNATRKTLTYESSDTSVLTVSDEGLVTAKKEGSANVIIRSVDDNIRVKFTVEKGVSKITVTTYKLVDDNTDEHTIVVKEGISAKIDDTYNFTFNNGAYVYDEDNSVSFKIVVSGSTTSLDIADDEMVFFGYNDGPIYLFDIWNYVDIEFVSSEQIEEGGEQGQGGGTEVAVTALALNKDTLSLKEGESEVLTATITPENASNTKLTWETSDANVATVSNLGKVTAVKAGTATITVRSQSNPNVTATCAVTVNAETQDVVVNYTFEDEGGVEHTLAVVEGKEATIDGAYHFTFENGHYYFDDDDTCYFDIRHSGSDLLDFYNEGMSFYMNGIAEFYSEDGTVSLTVTD